MTVLYSFDPTGLAADNLVIEEAHAVTEAHYRDYHFLIPDFAPFYADGLVIRLAGSDPDLILTPGVDYYEVLPYEAATRSIGKPLYGAIALNSRWTTGVLLLTYQTLGGKWVADRAWVYKTLAERAYNPRTTVWDVLTNVTDTFPPINHTQNFSDFYDEGQLIQAIVNLGTDIAREADALPVIRHLRDHNNPHGVTLSQLNLSIATREEALDGVIETALITPYTLKEVKRVIQRDHRRLVNGIERYVSDVLAQLERHRLDLHNPHQVTKDQLGLGLVGNWAMADTDQIVDGKATDLIVNPAMLEVVRLSVLDNMSTAITTLSTSVTTSLDQLTTALNTLSAALTTHADDTANPHQVTKDQLGLGLVGDWAMADKTAALAGTSDTTLINPARLKEVRTVIEQEFAQSDRDLGTRIDDTVSRLATHADDTANPHQVTKAQVGLDLVQNYPIASDLEVANGEALDKYVTLRQIVAYLTSRGGLLYSLIPAVYEIIEGESLSAVLTTARVTTGSTFYWAVVHGTTTVANFTINDGTVSVVDNRATITVTSTLQPELNPDRTFSLIVREDTIDGRVVALSDPITLVNVTRLPDFSLTVVNGWVKLTDSTTATIQVRATNLSVGTRLYWMIDHGTTVSTDFVQNSGELIWPGTVYDLTVTAYPTMATRYLSSFKILLRREVDGEIICVSDTILFEGQKASAQVLVAKGLFDSGVPVTADNYFMVSNYSPPKKTAVQYLPERYSNRTVRRRLGAAVVMTMTASLPAINEGDSVDITIHSSVDIGSQSFYWKIVHNNTGAADFSTDQGVLAFNGSSARLTIQTLYRTIDSPDRHFTVVLLSDEWASTALATTGPIELINIATATSYSVTPSAWSILSKNATSLTATAHTPLIDSAGTLKWKIQHLNTEAGDFTVTTGNISIVDHQGTFTIGFSSLIKRQTIARFRIELWDFASPAALTVSAIVSVISDLQAVAIMQLESLYDPYVTPTARNYYWINNVGRRTLQSRPAIDHQLSLTAHAAAVNEGYPFTMTLTGVQYYDPIAFMWSIRHGSTTAADFTATSGTVTLVNGRVTFDVSTVFISANTGSKTFYVDVRYAIRPSDPALVSSTVLSIGNVYVPDPTYAVTTASSTYNTTDGLTIPVTVQVANTPDTSYTWAIVNPTVGNTYFDKVTGTVVVSGGTGSFSVVLKDAFKTVTSATFAVVLKTYNTSTVLATSQTLTVYSPSYSLVANATAQPEGSVWMLSLSTTRLPYGTPLYWSVVLGTALSSQFTTASGLVYSTGDTTTWSLSTARNLAKDIDRTFSVQIRIDSATGILVAQTGQLTIQDVAVLIFDPHWMMPCCLYEATRPIDAADYFSIGVHATLRR